MLGTLIEVLVRVWHNFRRRKPIRSGTVEYPQPTAVIRSLIQRLLAENMQESWADFRADRSEAWVQVALRDKTLAVNFAFPFKGGLTETLRSRGIEPPGWEPVYLEPGKAATYEAPLSDAEAVTAFVDLLFQRLFACGPVYSMIGYIDGSDYNPT